MNVNDSPVVGHDADAAGSMSATSGGHVSPDSHAIAAPKTVKDVALLWLHPIYGSIGVCSFVSAANTMLHHEAINSLVLGLMGLGCVLVRNGRSLS